MPDLPLEDAPSRFQLVFIRLLGVFARAEHPLALFLDDLQWLDAATLQLLEHLMTEPDVQHLLLLGAYRDNEVSPSHPLMRRLDAIRKTGAIVHDIVLSPLGLDDVVRLAAWAWGWRSAVRLSKLTEDGFGRRQMRPEGPCFNSRCRFALMAEVGSDRVRAAAM